VLLIRNVVGVCHDSLFEACDELIRQTVEMLKTTETPCMVDLQKMAVAEWLQSFNTYVDQWKC